MKHSIAPVFLGCNQRPASAGASLIEPPPQLQQLALNFLATFFTRRRVVVTFAFNFLATFSDDLFSGHLTVTQSFLWSDT